jgi:hypothetical protein
MTTKDTRADLRAWMDRWERVNELEREELQRMSTEDRFRQVAAMMRMALAFGWDAESQGEVEQVRALWVRLKKAAMRDPG